VVDEATRVRVGQEHPALLVGQDLIGRPRIEQFERGLEEGGGQIIAYF
jgi:hypothetical protein